MVFPSVDTSLLEDTVPHKYKKINRTCIYKKNIYTPEVIYKPTSSSNSDLAAVPIIATLFVSGPPLIFVYVCYLLARRCCGCCPAAEKHAEAEMTEKRESNQKDPGAAMKFIPDAEGGALGDGDE